MLRFVSKPGVGRRLASTSPRTSFGAGGQPIDRADWLALFVASDGAPGGLDPVRLQQGLFLFSRCPGTPTRSKYVFEPGIYGPSSDELDADLDRLAAGGQCELVPVRGASWSLYKPTDAAFDYAGRTLRQAEDEDLLDVARELSRLKRYVSSVGFGELLERVYTEHPEFAVNSVFHAAGR
ncbi:MAG TPA: hypothetical protein VL988_04590 [Solirubrobacteraceae bacterium]|nr:hypothetical protein [Solirubrobacteraceae bacterium]